MDLRQIRPPERITTEHDLTNFDSSEPALDDWLRRRALRNEVNGASRTYVVCVGSRVVGYYALSTGAIAHTHAPGPVKRNMPDPIPVIVLGRLAVDRIFHGKGAGVSLLHDALIRTLSVAETAGVRAILVHCLSENARRFYAKHGFVESPMDTMTGLITISAAMRMLGQTSE